MQYFLTLIQINELLEAQKAATKEVRIFCVLE